MQTFLPYPSFKESARVLDRQRLGKQRVEGMQILNTLLGHSKGWINHPAVKMWRGSEGGLKLYTVAMCNEWISRGYKDTIRETILQMAVPEGSSKEPDWLGNEEFHRSHQSNLLRKNKEYYEKYGWDVEDNLPYVWPVQSV